MMGERKSYKAPDGSVELILREDPSDKRLELEAAEVLKKLDGMSTSVGTGAPARPAAGEAPAATPDAERAATIKGFIWGAASMAALFGIGIFVWQQSKPKEAGTAASFTTRRSMGLILKEFKSRLIPIQACIQGDFTKAVDESGSSSLMRPGKKP